MSAPTITEQTGWRRPHPQTLLQGFPEAIDLLARITVYRYDLDDPDFLFYLERRGMFDLPGKAGSPYWHAMRAAGQGSGELPDRHSHTVYAAGRLTDAWELFCRPEAIDIMRDRVRPGPHDPYAPSAPWQPPARSNDSPHAAAPPEFQADARGQLSLF